MTILNIRIRLKENGISASVFTRAKDEGQENLKSVCLLRIGRPSICSGIATKRMKTIENHGCSGCD